VLEPGELWDLLSALGGEETDHVPVVALTLDGGAKLDVFRAEQVRSQPVAWRIRGFSGEGPQPTEVRAVLLGTTDGRAMLMMGADQAPAAGRSVIDATAETRPLADLADIIAQAVRRRFE
jgi:hypothetical protein